MQKHPVILFTVITLLLIALPVNTHAEDKAQEKIDLLLEVDVDVDRIINDIADEIVLAFRKEARKAKIPYSRLKKLPNGMSLHLQQITDQDNEN